MFSHSSGQARRETSVERQETGSPGQAQERHGQTVTQRLGVRKDFVYFIIKIH